MKTCRSPLLDHCLAAYLFSVILALTVFSVLEFSIRILLSLLFTYYLYLLYHCLSLASVIHRILTDRIFSDIF